MLRFPVSFEHPQAVWLLAGLLPLVFWMSRYSLAGLSRGRWWAANLTRCLVIALLVMALAGAQWNRRSDDLSVVFVLDRSRSIPEAQREQSWGFVRAAARDARENDRVGVVSFDGHAYIEQLPQRPGPDGGLHVDRLSPPFDPDQTDLARAVRTAVALFPPDTAKRIVVLSDGNETAGDVLAEVRAAAANGIAVDVVPLRYRHRNEVMFDKLTAPAYANLDEQVPLRMLIRSEQDTAGTILLYHDGKPVDLDPQTPGPGQRVTLTRGINPLTVRLSMQHSGAHRFEARFEPDPGQGDTVLANNVATAFTTVEGPASVLFIRHDPDDRHGPQDDDPLIEALRKERIEVHDVFASQADLEPITLQQYAAVILANLPADAFSERHHRALASYVRDLGGGLVMLGGDDSFGAGGWQGSVVEAVMPVRFDVDEVKEIPRGALAVTMHACEMPQGNHWSIEVCIAALKTLSRLDYFGVVDWGGGGYAWAVPMRVADDKRAIERTIRKMQSSDMPDFEVPLKMAYDALRATPAAQKHMIIISDGDPSPPTRALLNRFRGAKITISAVSVFPHMGGVDTMRWIAEQTGGRYYDLSKPGDEKKLPQIFIRESRVVRRPLLHEDRFTPRVRASLSPIMSGIGNETPALMGYVVTTPRKAADVQTPIVSHKNDPILAHWQCGLGRAVAFTSGWWTRWGPEWPAWDKYSKLWAQAIRWCLAQSSAANFEVLTRVEGNRAKVVVEALNKDSAYLNFLRMAGNVVRPDGSTQQIELHQTGPGRYETEFPADSAGTFLVNLQATGGSERPALIRTGVAVPYSHEFRHLRTNESLLRRMVDEAAVGRFLDLPPEQADVFSRDLPETLARRSVWPLLLQLAVATFLLDVAVRRIAVDPRAVARRLRGLIADLAGRFAPGRAAEATLGDLKTARDRVRAEKTAGGDASALADARRTAAPDAAAGRKFEAPRGAAQTPPADLRDTLGGAQASPTAPPPAVADESAKESPASTTERLLRAKRRTRDEDKK